MTEEKGKPGEAWNDHCKAEGLDPNTGDPLIVEPPPKYKPKPGPAPTIRHPVSGKVHTDPRRKLGSS